MADTRTGCTSTYASLRNGDRFEDRSTATDIAATAQHERCALVTALQIVLARVESR
jgi:hypothetical protein